MNILVTGATGFIGSHLCREMVRRGNSIFALSHSGKTDKVQQLLQEKRFHLLTGDILDADMITDIIRDNGITDVFHLAARLPDGDSIDDFQAFFDTNTRGTFNLLQAASRSKVDSFVYASTIDVYSEPPGYLPVDEKHPAKPSTIYGVTKLTGELYTSLYADKMSMMILRYAVVYGKFGPEKNAIPVFTKQALHNDHITIHGDGNQSNDFIHVDDVVTGTILAWEKDMPGIYNIGSGQETKVIDLAEKIKSITGSKSEMTFTGDNTEKPFRFVLDIGKSRKILGWSPRSLDEGLSQYIKEYKAEV